MREIKFRAWDSKGNQIIGHENLEMNSDGFIALDEEATMFPMEIIMQYTGLKDKNGKEIYEGDIVEWSAFKNGFHKKIGQIVWNEIKLGWRIKENYENSSPAIYLPHLTVISNIYENPELLK